MGLMLRLTPTMALMTLKMALMTLKMALMTLKMALMTFVDYTVVNLNQDTHPYVSD
jgi:hypothetical protein